MKAAHVRATTATSASEAASAAHRAAIVAKAWGDITRIDQNARRSRAVAGGGILCTAGQVADSLGADITTQSREAFAKIDQLLAVAGTDKTRVLSIQIWLTDLADYDAFNAVWDA